MIGWIWLACTPAPDGAAIPASSEVQPARALPSPPAVERLSATQILIAWSGAAGAPPKVDRTEAEAERLARELHQRAATEPIEVLARAYSDGPARDRGGQLGVWRVGTMEPFFEAALASVAEGELAPPVRTVFGWHVARRDPVVEIEVAHIVVGHRGALRSASERSVDEARDRAVALLMELRAGADFAALARRHSEDGSAPVGGALGSLVRGQMVPSFEDAAFALAPGQISEVVRTPYGFHLIRRIR